MHHAPGHGERAYPRRAEHWVDLVFEEQVKELREKDAARRVEYKGDEPEPEYYKRFGLQEALRLHLRSDGYAEEDGYKVRKHLLRRFGKRIKHAAFAYEVAEHKEPDERDRLRGDEPGDDRDVDREQDARRFGYLALDVGHTDKAFFFGGEQLYHRRLDYRHQRHIGICRDHYRADVFGIERLRHNY